MSRASELCERFDYPLVLSQALEEVAQLAVEQLGAEVGVVLSPSVSTGDFLWRESDDTVELLSDVDGFVFTDAPSDRIAAFQRGIDAIRNERDDPHFDIDVSYVPVDRLGRLPETYQMVETRLAGFELVGSGRLAGFPTRFDPRASRQAALLNLWKPLSSDEPERLARNLARTLLDIPLLAASESGTCVPGHRARARAFLADPPAAFADAPEMNEAVRLALEARDDPPGDAERLAEAVLPALRTMLARIDGRGVPADEPDAALVRRFSSWLPRRTPRRLGGELRSAVGGGSPSFRDLVWWLRRKEAMGAAACWGLLVHRFGTRPIASSTLMWLARFARAPRLDPDSPDLMARARVQYIAGFRQLYPSRDR